MVVREGAEDAGLVDVLLLLGEVHVGGLGLADELVRHAHLHEDAGVERVDEGVVRGPVHPVEILDGLVVPAADALIGRELAVVVQTADVLGSAAVQAGNGSAAVGTVVAGGGESQIDAGQELLESGLVYEGLVSRIGIGVDRSHVEVPDAGIHRQEGHEDTEDIIDLFHMLCPLN